jgi:Cu(I)/Ag(I) efflux system membrane fusion protein
VEADKNKQGEASASKATKGNTYSPAFTDSFRLLLTKYYDLKDAFVKSDTSAIRVAADAFNEILPGFSFNDVATKDSLIFETVKDRPGDIQAGLVTILKENDLEKKREGFEQVSQVVYDLVQTLKPNGIHAYYQFCPMAFNDRGAYWLSAADSIMNPYFGNKMLHCGEVKEDLLYQ